MKTVINVTGIALVVTEYCMLLADKPVIAGLAGLMAVAALIPIWFDERATLAVHAQGKRSPFGGPFQAVSYAVAPAARRPPLTSRRPSLRPVRPARAA